MVSQLTSQKAQITEAVAEERCVDDVTSRDRFLKQLLDDHRLIKHKEKLFDVSKRYFAAELSVGFDHSRSKRGDFT